MHSVTSPSMSSRRPLPLPAARIRAQRQRPRRLPRPASSAPHPAESGSAGEAGGGSCAAGEGGRRGRVRWGQRGRERRARGWRGTPGSCCGGAWRGSRVQGERAGEERPGAQAQGAQMVQGGEVGSETRRGNRGIREQVSWGVGWNPKGFGRQQQCRNGAWGYLSILRQVNTYSFVGIWCDKRGENNG